MNLRQKAKRYKSLYEQTLYKAIRPEIKMFNCSTVELKYKKSVPRELFPGVIDEAEIKQELAYELAKELAEHMTVDVEPSRNSYFIDFAGSVEVIKKNDNKYII